MRFREYDHFFLRYFSLLSFLITVISFPQFQSNFTRLRDASWVFPASIWSPTTPFEYELLLILILLGFLFCSYLQNSLSALILPILWLFAISFEFSFGKIDHTKHSFFFVALAYALVHRAEIAVKTPMLIAGAVACYFCSGLWKIRGLLSQNEIWNSAGLNLPYHIAYAIGEGSSEKLDILRLLTVENDLSSFLWIATALTQILGVLLSVAYGAKYPWILVIFISFHLATAYIMGILFLSQVILLVAMIFFLMRFRAKKLQESSLL